MISIIIPTFNSGEKLPACMKTIMDQTYKDVEVLVIDDGSTDETQTIMKTLKVPFDLRYIRVTDNIGAYMCRNIGLMNARGTYVTFLNTDEEWRPTKLADQIEAIGGDVIGVTVMYIRLHEDDGTPMGTFMPRENYLGALLNRRRILADIGYFQGVRYGADCEYIWRIRAKYGNEAVQCLHLKAPQERCMEDVYVFCKSKRMLSSEPWGMNHYAYDTRDRLSQKRREYQEQFTAWHEVCQDKLYVHPFMRIDDEYPLYVPMIKTAFNVHRKKIFCGVATDKSRYTALLRALGTILPHVDVMGVYLNDFDEIPSMFVNEPKIIPFLGREHAGNLKDMGKFYLLKTVSMAPQDVYLPIDGDISYPPDYVNRHAMKQIQYNGNCVIGSPKVGFEQALDADTVVDELGSISLSRKVIDKIGLMNVIEDSRYLDRCDSMISLKARESQVPVICMERPANWLRAQKVSRKLP